MFQFSILFNLASRLKGLSQFLVYDRTRRYLDAILLNRQIVMKKVWHYGSNNPAYGPTTVDVVSSYAHASGLIVLQVTHMLR